MLRSVLSVLAGYFFTGFLVLLTFAVLGRLVPEAFHEDEARIDSPVLEGIVVAGWIGAIAGGWVTARLAKSAPFPHALALAAIMLVMGIVTMSAAPLEQSVGYQIANHVGGIVGVLVGGGLGAAQRGRSSSA